MQSRQFNIGMILVLMALCFAVSSGIAAGNLHLDTSRTLVKIGAGFASVES